jgi:hypothetical protein
LRGGVGSGVGGFPVPELSQLSMGLARLIPFFVAGIIVIDGAASECVVGTSVIAVVSVCSGVHGAGAVGVGEDFAGICTGVVGVGAVLVGVGSFDGGSGGGGSGCGGGAAVIVLTSVAAAVLLRAGVWLVSGACSVGGGVCVACVSGVGVVVIRGVAGSGVSAMVGECSVSSGLGGVGVAVRGALGCLTGVAAVRACLRGSGLLLVLVGSGGLCDGSFRFVPLCLSFSCAELFAVAASCLCDARACVRACVLCCVVVCCVVLCCACCVVCVVWAHACVCVCVCVLCMCVCACTDLFESGLFPGLSLCGSSMSVVWGFGRLLLCLFGRLPPWGVCAFRS